MKAKWFVLLATIVVASAVGLFVQTKLRSPSTLVDGRMEPEAMVAAATLGGRVQSVLASPGQQVAAGQVLVRFHADDFDTRLQQARRTLASAPVNILATTSSFVERVPPSVWASLLQTDPARLAAEREYSAALAAFERNSTPAHRLRLRRAESQRVIAFRRTDELRPQIFGDFSKVRAEAESMIRWATAQRDRLDVQSPESGTVELLDLAAGDEVMPGTAVALVRLPGRWVITAKAQVPAGTPVEVLLPEGTRIQAKASAPSADGRLRVHIFTLEPSLHAGETVGLRF